MLFDLTSQRLVDKLRTLYSGDLTMNKKLQPSTVDIPLKTKQLSCYWEKKKKGNKMCLSLPVDASAGI